MMKKEMNLRPCPICGRAMEESGRRHGKDDEIFIRYACTDCTDMKAEAYAVEFLVEPDEAFMKRWRRARKL